MKSFATTYTSNNVILDTDMYADCDDCSDLCALLGMHATLNPIGVIISSLDHNAPMCADAIARFCGFNLSVGVNQSAVPAGTTGGPYTAGVASRFLPGVNYSSYPEAVATYRTLLAGAPNASVTIIMIGFAAAVAGLLQSPADGISALTGIQLVTAKVKQFCIVAGFLPSGAGESNLVTDPVSYSYLAANSPVPILWGGVELADFYDASIPAGLNLFVNPVAYAYNLYGSLTRPAFSQAAISFAANGLNGLYSYGGQNGTMTINSSTGADAWTATAGMSSYLVKAVPNATLQAAWEAAIAAGFGPANMTTITSGVTIPKGVAIQ